MEAAIAVNDWGNRIAHVSPSGTESHWSGYQNQTFDPMAQILRCHFHISDDIKCPSVIKILHAEEVTFMILIQTKEITKAYPGKTITEPATTVAIYGEVGAQRNVLAFNLGDGPFDVSVLIAKMDLEGSRGHASGSAGPAAPLVQLEGKWSENWSPRDSPNPSD
ncbi:hypothetical protein GH733_016204 [Mirounga leonina]|nr:hypothetical protein GH733_016204 [Mirounga leonina]